MEELEAKEEEEEKVASQAKESQSASLPYLHPHKASQTHSPSQKSPSSI
jgi:hypothetical protein